MELSVSLNYLRKISNETQWRSLERGLEICRDAGFRHVDYSPEYISDDWLDRAQRDREILDRMGISVEQTHAPFTLSKRFDPSMLKTYYDRLFRASKIVGAKYVVVHADEMRPIDHYDERMIQDYHYELLAPYVEYAEKNGLVTAIENLFENGAPRPPVADKEFHFTARVHELKGIIERFDSPAVACCWDFGHAKCAFGAANMLCALKEVGQYLCCTHVHDNYYGKDLHLMPFLGEVDWESHMAYLGEIGYRGKLSFEFVYGRMPERLLPMWLKSVHAVGEYLIGLSGESTVV